MNKINKKISRLVFFVALFFWPFAVSSAEPTGPVILEVAGLAENQDQAKQFDREMLEALGRTDITTDTPWTEGEVVFSGVLMRNLIDLENTSQNTIRAIALNDYAVDIPVADIIEYDVIVALQRDGNYLTVRDRGPLWVIYPWAETPALRTEVHYSRSIWQLRRLELYSD